MFDKILDEVEALRLSDEDHGKLIAELINRHGSISRDWFEGFWDELDSDNQDELTSRIDS